MDDDRVLLDGAEKQVNEEFGLGTVLLRLLDILLVVAAIVGSTILAFALLS